MANKSTKKALLLSVLSMILCLAMLVGTTFAWFTDSATSGRNTITAGNLDVVLEYWDGAKYATVDESTKLFNDDALWEPGHTEVAYLKVSNAGTLALKYQLNVNVYEEVTGTNVAGEEFYLSDHLVFKVANDVEISSATDPDLFTRETAMAEAGTVKGLKSYNSGEKALEKNGDAAYVALIIYMPTSVGNEANYKTGTVAPSITMGVNLVATQAVKESDFFNNQYDKDATYPTIIAGSTDVDRTAGYQEINAYNAEGGKIGWARVPTTALTDTAETIRLNVVKTDLDGTVIVAADQKALTYDVIVTGVKEGNTEDIEVIFEVGTGLTGVELYHKNEKVDGNKYEYLANTGDIRFFTTSFSPFTVVFDAVPQPSLPTGMPKANVNQIAAPDKIKWESYGGMSPANPDQKLDAVYTFAAPHDGDTVKDTEYQQWYCDYFVELKSTSLTEIPEGYITLGGNYGDWGWVGFDNPAVPTNTQIPLLGSVIENDWTYGAVVSFVSTFTCGVGLATDADGNAVAGTALDGCEFVVRLRLTNPANADEYYDVNTVTYTFGAGTSVIK